MLTGLYRRVDDDLRSSITNAMKNTSSVSKQKLKESQKGAAPTTHKSRKQRKIDDADSASDGGNSQKGVMAGERKERDLDFVRYSSSAPKRLNDIAQAPPELKGVPRLARLVEKSKSKHTTMNSTKKSKGVSEDEDDSAGSILTAQQKRMMELEREKAINRYRALKEVRLKEKQSNPNKDVESA